MSRLVRARMASRRLRDAEPATFQILRGSGENVVELDDPELVPQLDEACCPSAHHMLWKLYGLRSTVRHAPAVPGA